VDENRPQPWIPEIDNDQTRGKYMATLSLSRREKGSYGMLSCTFTPKTIQKSWFQHHRPACKNAELVEHRSMHKKDDYLDLVKITEQRW